MHPLAPVPGRSTRHRLLALLVATVLVGAAGNTTLSSSQASGTLSVSVTVVRGCTVGVNGFGLACGGGEAGARLGLQDVRSPSIVESWSGGAPSVAGAETMIFTVEF